MGWGWGRGGKSRDAKEKTLLTSSCNGGNSCNGINVEQRVQVLARRGPGTGARDRDRDQGPGPDE
eukprot:5415090-Karenia_brevis.AAC.1